MFVNTGNFHKTITVSNALAYYTAVFYDRKKVYRTGPVFSFHERFFFPTLQVAVALNFFFFVSKFGEASLTFASTVRVEHITKLLALPTNVRLVRIDKHDSLFRTQSVRNKTIFYRIVTSWQNELENELKQLNFFERTKA